MQEHDSTAGHKISGQEADEQLGFGKGGKHGTDMKVGRRQPFSCEYGP